MAFKPYQVTKKINGKEYTAQFNGIGAALDAVDGCYIPGTQNISSRKMAKYLLDNVIVDPPRLSVDDFKSLDELTEVTDFARDVMQGNFRDEEDEIADTEKNKG